MQAVLFDLDDTLIDRRASLEHYASVLARAHAHRLAVVDPHALYAVIQSVDGAGYRARGRVAEDLARHLPWRNAPSPGELAAFWDARFPACAQPTGELFETLAWLRAQGLRIGIVTNGRTAIQEQKIASVGLAEWVDSVVISEAIGIKKPDPRIFGIACERVQVPKSATWFVGDHPANDIVGATAAGLTAVWFRREAAWPDDYPPPKYSITRLRELRALLLETLAGNAPSPDGR